MSEGGGEGRSGEGRRGKGRGGEGGEGRGRGREGGVGREGRGGKERVGRREVWHVSVCPNER